MPCALCQHRKIDAINAALDAKRHPAVIAMQFRLDLSALKAHMSHHAAGAASGPVRPGLLLDRRAEPMVEDEPEQLDQRMAEHYFRTGWRDMDEARRQKNLQWLRDILHGEDMGL